MLGHIAVYETTLSPTPLLILYRLPERCVAHFEPPHFSHCFFSFFTRCSSPNPMATTQGIANGLYETDSVTSGVQFFSFLLEIQ